MTNVDSNMASQAREFSVEEVVLAYHEHNLYKAQVVDVKDSPSELYHVRFDQAAIPDKWMAPDCLLRYTLANLVHQETLRRADATRQPSQQQTQPQKAEKASRQQQTRSQKAGKDKKRKATTDTEEETKRPKRRVKMKISTHMQFKIVFPATLKKRCFQDWTFVSRQAKLVPLPREPCVSTILQSWVTSKPRPHPRDKMAKETMLGLLTYFDRALGPCLLYRFERPQYYQILNQHQETKDLRLSNIYGAEHLLRLLVRLPTIISQTYMDADQRTTIQSHVNELAQWLSKQQDLFLTEYEAPLDRDYADKVLQVLRKQNYQFKNMLREEVSSDSSGSIEEEEEGEDTTSTTVYMSGRKKKIAFTF